MLIITSYGILGCAITYDAVTQAEAWAVARAAGGGKTPVGPEIDKGKLKVKGYYYHYHVNKRKGGHVFFAY